MIKAVIWFTNVFAEKLNEELVANIPKTKSTYDHMQCMPYYLHKDVHFPLTAVSKRFRSQRFGAGPAYMQLWQA